MTAFNKGGAGGTVTLFTSNASSAAGAVITQNSNNFSNITLTGATAIAGWSNTDGGSPTKSISGNTFSSWTTGSSSITVINASYFGNNSAVSNNTISNINGQSTITGIAVGSSGTSTLVTVANNSVTGLTSSVVGGTVIGISTGASSFTVTNVINNTISGLSTLSTCTGMAIGGGATVNVTSNLISTLSTSGGSSTVTGLLLSGGTTPTVSLNTIHTLTGTGTTLPLANGLQVSGGTTVTISKNKIYNIAENGTMTPASPVVNGILLSGGTNVTTVNNIVGDLRAPATSSTEAIRGISVSSTTTSSTQNVYYNTVWFAAVSSGANFGTTGLFHQASATATTAALNLRNNIIDNRSTPSGTGVTVAFRRSVGTAGTLANYASTSNNNDFSAGTPPGATRLIYSDGTSTATTIAAYKAGVFTAGTIAPRDTASFSDPTYLSTTGSDPTFLHIDPTIATQVESGAVNIAGIADDFDGQVRQGNAGYGGTGTAPDVGADEFGGIPLDLSPPTIAYTTLGNGAASTTRILGNVAVTDPSGVNTTAGTRPRVYYKKSTDTNDLAATGWKYVEATGGGGSPFSFTIDYTLLNAGSVSIGDVIQYFVVAQDSATTPNVGINSGAFAATPASVALTSAAFPIAGTINSYNIVATITGTKTVCSAGPPTCDYGSLTNAGGVFADINSKVVGSNLDIQIASDLTAESGSNALGVIAEDPVGNYSVKIYPTGAARTVTGTGTGGILIGLIGSDRVTIDGSVGGVGTDRSLTLSNPNTATGTGTIFIGSLGAGAGATNDTIKNCIIKSTIGTTANFTFGMFVGSSSGAAAGPDNDNLTIRNNQILQARTGIQAVGDPTGLLDGLVIADNLIGDAAFATSIGRIGMTVQQTSGASITGNTIKNIYIATDTSSPIAISIVSWTGGTISQNAIAGMQCSGSVAVAAIAGSSSTGVTITQNSIDGVAGAFAGTGTGNTFGITLGSGFINSSVTRNTIKNITYSGTGGYSGKGIDISTANAASNLLIANNSISNIKGDGWSTLTSDGISGIRLIGTTGGVSLYYNSVNLGSGSFAGNTSGTLSAALYVDTSVTNLDVRNNVFATNLVNSSASTAKTYAVYSAAAASAFTFIDRNDYYASGTQGVLGFIGGLAKTTLADWQSGTGKDASSIAANPLFNTSTDLQPSVGSPLLGAGVPVSVLVDIAGTTRSLTTPTIGAYETPISADLAVSQTDSPDPVATNGTVTYTVTVTNNGPYPATSPIMSVTIPTMFTLAPITPPSGWSCTAPAGGIFTCSATSMAPSTNAVFPIAYQVAYCAGNGTTSHNVTVSSATGDANPANNSSSEITTITDSGLCSDNNPCTGPDLCSGTVCVPGPNPCEDNNACTNDVCGAGGSCTYTPVVCVDGNPCTDDSCNPATGCVYTNNTLPCSDGNVCTIGDVCSAGACVPGPAPTPVTFCSTGSISIPSTGAATPYPSNVAVTSGGSYLCNATVKLNGISHTFPADIDVLLVGPAGQNAIIMSDVGSSTAVSGVNLTLDDSAANPLPSGSGLSSGTFQPTNSGTGDTFPAPAPAPAGGSALSVFTGTNPIGTWSLYVYDDVSGDSGSMTGWCVNLAMACGTDADCSDGNPCTDDTCVAGGCVHTPNTASCDDGNACTTVDACAGGVCVGGSPVNCDDSDACTTDSCNPADGQCSHVTITCNDNNTCTDDTCNPATGCVYTPNDANTCTDGNACTQTDLCQAGACVGTNPVVCDDGNPCTTDTCNTTSGACVYTNNTNPCDDGNPCTTGDTCGPHFGQTFDGVTSPAIPAGWTTTLVVGQTGDPAWYTSTSFFDTPPNAARAEDTTHSTDKVLDSPPIAIATASARLTFRNKYDLESGYDGCVLEISIGGGAFQDIIAAGGAFVSGGYNGTISATSTSTPLAGRSAWTGTSTGFVTSVVDLPPAAAGQSVVLRWRVATDLSLGYSGGEFIDSIALQDPAGPWTCQPGGPTNCDDGNACTADSCNPASGCVHAPIVCNDGNACTADSCDVLLGCVYTAITCDDANACTADSCDVLLGCVYAPITCDDGNLCTADTCNAATGCVFTTISCDDANACTTDTCNPATGCAHTAITCDDSNLCTTDTCNPATGCAYTPNPPCDDNNLCTTDTCDPASGCVYTPNAPCNDNSACTADTCDPATGCVYTPISCDDNNVCTDDSCIPATGCAHSNNTNPCEDGDTCTTPDVCAAGACVPGLNLCGPVLSVPPVTTTCQGTDVLVPITLANGSGVVAIDMILTYDPSVLTPTGVYTTTHTAGWTLTTNLTLPGQILISLFSTSPLSGSGDVATVLFHTIGSTGSSTTLHWTQHDLNEGNLASVAFDGVVQEACGQISLSVPDDASGAPAQSRERAGDRQPGRRAGQLLRRVPFREPGRCDPEPRHADSGHQRVVPGVQLPGSGRGSLHDVRTACLGRPAADREGPVPRHGWTGLADAARPADRGHGSCRAGDARRRSPDGLPVRRQQPLHHRHLRSCGPRSVHPHARLVRRPQRLHERQLRPAGRLCSHARLVRRQRPLHQRPVQPRDRVLPHDDLVRRQQRLHHGRLLRTARVRSHGHRLR